MSDRPYLKPESVVTNGDMSGDLTSSVTILNQKTIAGYEANWSSGSSLSGTLSIQVSNSYSLNANGTVNNTGTWNTLTLTDDTGSIVTSLPVSGASGSQFFNCAQLGGYAIRLIYTSSAGTGTLNVILVEKVM